MVKKVNSSGSATRTTAAGAAATNEVAGTQGTNQVGGVRDVKGASAAGAASKVRKPTRPMTAAERADLLNLVRDEATKMFAGASDIPESKRATIEQAVRMALDSSAIDEEQS